MSSKKTSAKGTPKKKVKEEETPDDAPPTQPLPQPTPPKKQGRRLPPAKPAPKSEVQIEEEKEAEQRQSLLESHNALLPIIRRRIEEHENFEVTNEDIAPVQAEIDKISDFDNYSEDPPKDPLRFLMLGKHGQGKSMLCNFILDDKADPKTLPFESRTAVKSVTAVPMTASYHPEKRIRAIFHNGAESPWYDWDNDIMANVTDGTLKPLDVVKALVEEDAQGLEDSKIASFEVGWPSTFLQRFNVEITDMPGFDPKNSEPVNILRAIFDRERTLPVHQKAVLVVFVPHDDRAQVVPESHLHLNWLDEAGLFRETSVADLPPFVFLRNNTAGLNDHPETCGDALQQFQASIPHMRKIIYATFDVRDRDDTGKKEEFAQMKVPNALPSLKTLAQGSLIADCIADHCSTNSCWFVRLTEALTNGENSAIVDSPLARIIRYLRARRRWRIVHEVAEFWLNRLMLPVKLATLKLVRPPEKALNALSAEVVSVMTSMDPHREKLTGDQSINFWQGLLGIWKKRLSEIKLDEPQAGPLTLLNDEECQAIGVRFLGKLKELVEVELIFANVIQNCQDSLTQCQAQVARFASGKLGNKGAEFKFILQELGDALSQRLAAQMERPLVLEDEKPRLNLLAELERLADYAEDKEPMLAAVRDAATKCGVGHIEKNTGVSEMISDSAALRVIDAMVTNLSNAFSVSILSPRENYFGTLVKRLERLGQAAAKKIRNFQFLAVPESFLKLKKGNALGKAPTVEAVVELSIFQDFESLKALESKVKKLEAGPYGSAPPLKNLPSVDIKRQETNQIINPDKPMNWIAKKSSFPSMTAFEEDDKVTKLPTARSEKLEFQPSRYIPVQVTLGKKPRIDFKLPPGAQEWLQRRYSNHANSNRRLSPLLFSSKLLARKDDASGVLLPNFHLDDIQQRHSNTVAFIVIDEAELQSYTAMLGHWLWHDSYSDDRVAVFLISVSSTNRIAHPNLRGWMNAGRGWQIGKLLLEHLNFSERFFILSDRYKEFGFWTNFRRWHRIVAGAGLELLENIMTFEQNHENSFANFKGFMVALAGNKFAANKDSGGDFEQLCKFVGEEGARQCADVIWNGSNCHASSRHLLDNGKLRFDVHGFQEFLRKNSTEASKKLDQLIKLGKDKVAMIGIDQQTGAIGQDGFVRGTLTLEGFCSHRACLGKYWSPLVNRHACTGVDIVDPVEFFRPPETLEFLSTTFPKKYGKKSGKKAAKQGKKQPKDSWEDVFGTAGAKSLAARGFSDSLKKFAADLWLRGRLSFRTSLLSYTYLNRQKRDKQTNCEYLYFESADVCTWDALRAHCLKARLDDVSWPKNQLDLQYSKDHFLELAEDKPSINPTVLHLDDQATLWNLEVITTAPDGNSLFHAISSQIHKGEEINPETGVSKHHLQVRRDVHKWLSNNLHVVVNDKSVSTWISDEFMSSTTADQFLEALATPGRMIGAHVTLIGVVKTTKRPVIVFRSGKPDPVEFSTIETAGKKPILLGLLMGQPETYGHFIALQPCDPDAWVPRKVNLSDSTPDGANEDADPMDVSPGDDADQAADAPDDAEDAAAKKTKKKRKREGDSEKVQKKAPSKRRKK